MARCPNCYRTCESVFCSLDCATERYSLMLEHVDLLDAFQRLVEAAAERLRPKPTLGADSVARPKPEKASGTNEKPPALFASAVSTESAAAATGAAAGGFDPPGRSA